MGRFTMTLVIGVLLSAGQAAGAEQEIGKVVALRGSATIERAGTVVIPAVNSGIQASDVIKTAADCRVKLRFVDDSILTVGEKSRLVIKEFLYSREKGGRSIFNLLDGKMHSVVGKTKFEVQTPTAVAAARGTVIYFEAGMASPVNQQLPDESATRPVADPQK